MQCELEAKPPAATKCCRTCKAEKALDQFTKHRLAKDGHRHDCKDCVAAGRAKRQQRTPEQLRAERERRRKPHRRVACDLAAKAWYQRNREARAAQSEVRRELRKGRITRPSACQAVACNTGGSLHAHHNNYARAREVVWLCAGHHRRLHNGHRVKLKPTASARYARAPKTK
jgi:hypothetical protein